MKKTNLLLTSAAAVLVLAACGGGKGDTKVKGIVGFCETFETIESYTVTFEESGTIAKFTKDAVDMSYISEDEEEETIREGHYVVDGNGIYAYESDETGALVTGNIETVNYSAGLDTVIYTASFFAEAGDEVWEDTDDSNVFTSTKGKFLALAGAFFGYDGYEDYSTGATLEFDDVNNITEATLTIGYDLSEYYGEEYAFDVSAVFSDFNSTTIEGIDALRAKNDLPAGVGTTWTEEEKAGMMEACGEVLPTLALSYASRTEVWEEYNEFDIYDIGGCGQGKAFGEALVRAGWTFMEDDSESSEAGEAAYSYNYYQKEFAASEESDGGYYLIEVDDVSSECYAETGDDYAAMYPNGTFTVYAYRVDYTSYEDFIEFINTSATLDGETVTPAPAFSVAPSKIVVSDNSLVGMFYYGSQYWYNVSASFDSAATAATECRGYMNSLVTAGWELDDQYVEEYNTYILTLDLTGDYEGNWLEVDVCFDPEGETGDFAIDFFAF